MRALSTPDAVRVRHRTDAIVGRRQTHMVIWRIQNEAVKSQIQGLEGPFQLPKEQIMDDTKVKMACHEHHLAAARHVAAAYHHFQAVAEHEKGNHDEAMTHASAAQDQGGEAHQHTTSAVEHCH